MDHAKQDDDQDGYIPWEISRWNGASDDSLIPRGFPILYNENTGDICQPVFLYLYETFAKDLKRELKARWNTLLTKAYQLKQWWEYLNDVKLSWVDALPEHVTGYVQGMEDTASSETGEAFSEQTIKSHVSTIAMLYKWAGAQAEWRALAYSGGCLLNLAKDAVDARYFTWPEIKTDREKYDAQILLPHEVEEVSDQLGKQATATEQQWLAYAKESKSTPIPQSSRNRLAVDIVVRTGLRVAEVCWLKLRTFKQLLNRIDQMAESEALEIEVFGKGRKARKVEFSGVVLKQIAAYVRGERGALKNSCDRLLVNPPKLHSRWIGAKTTPRALQRAFSDACIATGHTLERVVAVWDELGRKVEGAYKVLTAAKFVFHGLRHTFAVTTFFIRKRTDEEPWLYIQKQLGHASLQTTVGIYLSKTKWYEQKVSDAYMARLRRGRLDG